MMSGTCIFCRIIAREIPAVVIYETGDVLVIQDRMPKAPIHYLVIPKTHYADLRDIPSEQTALMATLLQVVQHVASEHLSHGPFKLVVNNGAEVGQRVFHLHLHMLAGDTHAEIEMV